jgi:acetyl esterase/lipase
MLSMRLVGRSTGVSRGGMALAVLLVAVGAWAGKAASAAPSGDSPGTPPDPSNRAELSDRSGFPVAVAEADCDAWADGLIGAYRVQTDIVYRTASGRELTLDVYRPRQLDPALHGKNPSVIWFHGGGWVLGDKNGSLVRFLPLVRLGYTVFTVDYRLAGEAPAPAAVEDARFAVRWVQSRAAAFDVDPERVILMGTSAGAHLALMAGMLPVSAGYDHAPGSDSALGVSVADWWSSATLEEVRVAAIVDFWGIADVADLVQGPHARNWAIDWIGNARDLDLAARVSPIAWVRPALPPILIIHGDPDPVVPFEQSVRLSRALEEAGVPNRLVRVPGGGHGDFVDPDWHRAWNEVRAFLADQRLLPHPAMEKPPAGGGGGL